MGRALLTAIVAAALAAATTAAGVSPAAAAEVTLRIEGATQTHFEGPVSTSVHEVDGGDGTGPHACSGGLGSTPGPTATTALDDGARAAGLAWRGRWNPDFHDFFVDSIATDHPSPPTGYWTVLVNGRSAGGGCTTKVKDGDEVLWAYGVVFKPNVLRLTGPSEVPVGAPFAVTVTADGEPVAGASVGGATTGADGTATLSADRATRLTMKAERSDAIRSNGLVVCVGVEQGCDSGPGPDPRPELSIAKIEPGGRYARGAGPRILRGTATMTGRVELSLGGRGNGGRCRVWDAPAGDFRRSACDARRYFPADLQGRSWSARVGALPPGNYTLRARSAGTGPLVRDTRFTILRRNGSTARLVRRGLGWLGRAQRPGGGFGTVRGGAPSVGMTGWATMALAGTSDRPAGRGAGYLRRNLAGGGTADLVRTAFAVAAADGERPRRFARRLCGRLARAQSGDGSFGGSANETALAILALRTTGCRAHHSLQAARWLAGQGAPGGGFGFTAGAPADVDTTGLVTWALSRVAETRGVAREASDYLRAAQGDDGGFGSVPGGASNSQSTGFAIAGLRSVGVRPSRVRTEDGIDPIDYLTTIQTRSGAIAYSRGAFRTPVWTTSQALLGLGPRAKTLGPVPVSPVRFSAGPAGPPG